MSTIKELNSSNFDETINNGISLVDFWAEWCGPCKQQLPVITQLAEKYSSKFNICKLDVDTYQNIAAKYEVMSIPTIIIFQNGEVKKQFVGFQSSDFLAQELLTI